MAPGDLREHLALLEQNGLLHRVEREINKDTELFPLLRWQFRGLREEERLGFWFERVVDQGGRRYEMPVVAGVYGSSRQLMALGMGCAVPEIGPCWANAVRNPVAPVAVSRGACQEVVHHGADLTEHGGLLEFPFPIYTPGFDPAPYSSASHWITRDPETGVGNVGNHRAQIKSATRTGLFLGTDAHMRRHWLKARARGESLPAALVIGAAPAIAYGANARVAEGLDELGIAGALVGQPIELVPCVAIDLAVPAHAEIVVEGHVSTEFVEPEAPFGEFLGYMGQRMWSYVFEVAAITHRREPILATIASQMPPSEASVLSTVRKAAGVYTFLTRVKGFDHVKGVDIPEWASGFAHVVVRLAPGGAATPMEVLEAAAAADPTSGRFFIAVDDDIDGRDAEAVSWAMWWRMEPHRDLRVVPDRVSMLDSLVADPTEMPLVGYHNPSPGPRTSALLIDATRKHGYMPVSLPARPYMERAREIWEAEGLPALRPKSIWHGYELDVWTEAERAAAQRAVEGRFLETGAEALEQRRRIEELESQQLHAPTPAEAVM
jgi:4-hydroxy-3-polyprenylbenzoate decarboxylase